jgi:hypothetical protein
VLPCVINAGVNGHSFHQFDLRRLSPTPFLYINESESVLVSPSTSLVISLCLQTLVFIFLAFVFLVICSERKKNREWWP